MDDIDRHESGGERSVTLTTPNPFQTLSRTHGSYKQNSSIEFRIRYQCHPPFIRNREHQNTDVDKAGRSRQQTADSRQQTADSRQQTADSRYPNFKEEINIGHAYPTTIITTPFHATSRLYSPPYATPSSHPCTSSSPSESAYPQR
jgi:hypothetical protein